MSLKEFKILKDLCFIQSPSNFEELLIAYIESFNFKNFHFKKTKKNSCYYYNKNLIKDAKTIMFDAHIDQVHLRVVNIVESDGVGYVMAVSVGFDPIVLNGNSVVHINSKMKGNIVTVPPHLNIPPQYTKGSIVCIDFGMSVDETKDMISMGDAIVFNLEWYQMNNKYIVSSGLDNKVSAFTLLKTLEWLDSNIDKLAVNIYFNFSSREEIGLGSYAPLLHKDFDEIVVLDTEIATDNQYISKNLVGRILLDKGIVITHNYDDDRILSEKFSKFCDENRIDYQETFSAEFGNSNLQTYSKFNEAYTQFIGIPLRNMHSPTEIVSMHDLREAYKFVCKYVCVK